MELIGLIVIGGLAGWIAGTLIRGAGYGLVINIVVGVIGGIIGGTLFDLLGISQAGGWAQDGWLVDLAMAVVGAVLLLILVTLARRALRRAE